MAITLTDLVPLMPLIITTLTVVIAMIAVGVKRHYASVAGITIIGLLFAAISSLLLMPAANYQVTPLLIIDEYTLFFTIITCCSAVSIAILSYQYLSDLDDYKEEYFLLLGLATIGAIIMVSSNHYVSAILGIETLSMSLYGMVAYPSHSDKSRRWSLEAAVKYLVLSAAASGFMLFGIALIYAQTGSLSFSSVLDNGGTLGLGEDFSATALTLLFIGAAFKLSLAPFHMWTPDVYEGSPLPATTYLATIGKVAMFVVLLRLIESTNALAFQSVFIMISLVAVLSIFLGNLLALLQSNLKRILAYSSISHMGYLLIALLASFEPSGLISIEAITFYLVAYMIMSIGAFGVASIVSSSNNEFDSVDDYTGLFWRNPILAAIFTGMLLSLAGIPLTAGFIGKFYIFFAGVESELWVLLLALIIGSGIGLYYYLRVVYRMVLPQEQKNSFELSIEKNYSSSAILVLLFALLIILGVYPTPLVSVIERVSSYIL